MNIRNIAIVAHVDHGKTTLVDRLLQQTDADRRLAGIERALDSNELERERGITILAKATSIAYRGVRINIVDTPGHADFGGEVERILSMVDSVLLLVDAVEGPMPQTRFVTSKAFAAGLKPILVVNKIDRDGAQPHAAVDKVFDLFDALGATEEQLDFPVMFASALEGVAGPDPEQLAADMTPLLDLIVEQAPPPSVDGAGPFRMQVSTLDYSSYVGVIGIGLVARGRIAPRDPVDVVDADGNARRARVLSVEASRGLARVELPAGEAGDIVAITGIDNVQVSDTICAAGVPEPLPRLNVDEPTLTMTFVVNSSPFAGREGRFLTARHLRERLFREATHNVALRVADTAEPDRFQVSGRGELHLSVLIETMRREGYEMAVSQPSVITREEGGHTLEPWESVAFDIDLEHQGVLMESLGERRGELLDMEAAGKGRVRISYRVASRALLGLRSEFASFTSGSGVMTFAPDGHRPWVNGVRSGRNSGVLVSNATGKAVAYALFNLQRRGQLFIAPGDAIYAGMVVGAHSRSNDLVVNPLKEKKLTNIRAAANDENILLTPALRMSLEQALNYIAPDELVEVTPAAIRIRKADALA